MHIDPNNPNWLARANGRTYMGVPGFRIFHGQEARPFNQNDGGWRVEGGGGSQYTARNGWDCPDANGYWYVGMPRAPTDALSRQIQRWGERLYTEGYVGAAGLRLIVEPPTDSHDTELNPENPGYVVRPPRGYTTAAGDLNPYELNFLMDGGSYSFVTAPHPPPPSKK